METADAGYAEAKLFDAYVLGYSLESPYHLQKLQGNYIGGNFAKNNFLR